jgi:hypothetical protein
MPETISARDVLGLTPPYALALERSAVSTEARAVRQAASEVVERAERTRTFGRKAEAISQIWALANECASHDWNGEGALPIGQLAVFEAAAFIRALPEGIPLPEFAPEPDGSISLDWIWSRSRIFSVSVGPSDRLAYAWLDGTDKGHAVARFDRERIPDRILEGIKGFLQSANAAVGPR